MRLGFALACALLLTSITVSAKPTPQLRLLSEHAVDGMRGGNLSGLAQCGKRAVDGLRPRRRPDLPPRYRRGCLARGSGGHRRPARAGQRLALGAAFAGLGVVVRARR